ncbi:MAG: hypothetical protein M3Z24_07710 [Chloroflexota bacterium]|nr:hypothetical protein [Chloroflexota bacterium]
MNSLSQSSSLSQPLRSNRLVSSPLDRGVRDGQPFYSHPSGQSGPLASGRQMGAGISSRSQSNPLSSEADTLLLKPGTLLRGGRYRLYEMQERQEWLHGVYETMWVAQDAQRAGSQVMIRELMLPDNDSGTVQSILRTATIALTSVGRHPHLPTLRDAFSDRGRSFFVFEPLLGESLAGRLRRNGRAMMEQEIIEVCLQMTEVLDLLWQQSPPLIHGLIRPEHIIIGRSGSQYALTNFSIVLAGGATQFIAGIDRTFLNPYTAPEFVRGIIDGRSDIYALLATAYYAVTGSVPAGVGGSIPSVQRLNPNISPQFDAIITKGLRPDANKRYQRPSELRQELLAIRSGSPSLILGNNQTVVPTTVTQQVPRGRQQFEELIQQQNNTNTNIPDSLAEAFQSLAPSDDLEEQKLLLPRPEELPPLSERNDRMQAILWLAGILVCLLVIIIVGRGLL